jgi:hypothetical protein
MQEIPGLVVNGLQPPLADVRGQTPCNLSALQSDTAAPVLALQGIQDR